MEINNSPQSGDLHLDDFYEEEEVDYHASEEQQVLNYKLERSELELKIK